MIILSLFNGMSVIKMVVDYLGLTDVTIYYSEVDKYANELTEKLYPEMIPLGDVTNWRSWKIPQPDIIVGGSPCQGFSQAGTGGGFDDPRSKLFFSFLEILGHYKPDYFLLENVKMKKKEWMHTISGLLGVQPVMINSALVSAQNRRRYYWANVPITQPKDGGLVLADILESGEADRDKSLCITSRIAGATAKRYLEKSQHQMVLTNVNPSGKGQNGNVYSIKAKSPTLTTNKGEGPKIFDERNKVYQKPIESSYRTENPIPESSEKHPTLRAQAGGKTRGIGVARADKWWRKLTPRECMRLQTVPEHIIDKMLVTGISNAQLYRMAGNGWTMKVIAHILGTIWLHMRGVL